MTEKYQEPHPMRGTSSDPLEDEIEKKRDRRTEKQQANKKSMEFGRRMGAKEYS